MTVIRRAVANTTSMSCSVNTTVRPVSRAISAPSLISSCRSRGAMTAAGSAGRAAAVRPGRGDAHLEPALVAVRHDAAGLGRLRGESHTLEEAERFFAIESARRTQHVEVAAVMAEQRGLHVFERTEPPEDAR